MNHISQKASKGVLLLLEYNYYLSALLLVCTTVITLSGNDILFGFDRNLHNPIANNLLLMLVYLMIIEVAIVWYCHAKKGFLEVTILGSFYILIIGSLEFYSKINHIPIDSTYQLFFFYIGLSHIIFGISTQVKVG